MTKKEKEKHVYLLMCGWKQLPRKQHHPICYAPPFDSFNWSYRRDDAVRIEKARNAND
jgi:hypothetical protein